MLSLTKSPLPVAMLSTAFTVSGLVLLLPAGLLADRWDRRKILLFAQSVQTASALLLAVTTWLGWTTPAVLLVASAGLGLGSSLSSPSWNSIVPELVPRGLTAEAVTLNSVAFNIARAVGPALGGLVLAARGPGMAFFLNAVSFLAVIEVLRRYPAFRTAAERAVAVAKRRRPEPTRKALVASIHAVRKRPGLKAAHLSVSAFALAASSFPALLPVFAKTTLGTDASGYGMMLGAIGVGAVTGAVLLKWFRATFHARSVVSGGMLVYGLVMLAVSRTASLHLTVLLLLPAGVGWLSSLSSLNALVQLSAPAHVKSRILALYQMAFLTAWSIGSGIGGLLANRIGVNATISLAGLGVVAAAGFSARLALPSWDVEPDAGEPLATPLPASVR